MIEWDWTAPQVCPICKKEYFMTSKTDWAYKRGPVGRKKYFCSYKCATAYDKEVQKRKPKKSKDE